MLFTTLVLSTSFLIYTLSSLSNVVRFGFLTAICIGLAFIADVLLAPALIALLVGREKERAETAGWRACDALDRAQRP